MNTSRDDEHSLVTWEFMSSRAGFAGVSKRAGEARGRGGDKKILDSDWAEPAPAFGKQTGEGTRKGLL